MLIIRIFIPYIANESPRILIPSLEMPPSQGHEIVRWHFRRDDLNILLGDVSDTFVFDAITLVNHLGPSTLMVLLTARDRSFDSCLVEAHGHASVLPNEDQQYIQYPTL